VGLGEFVSFSVTTGASVLAFATGAGVLAFTVLAAGFFPVTWRRLRAF
jgi:hypothetical protein